MNKKTKKNLTRQKRIWEYSVAKRKKNEREIAKMEREVEKMQNYEPQIVKKTSTKELERIELSKLPKEPRVHRKKRKK